mgnify:CR=1 FL=1
MSKSCVLALVISLLAALGAEAQNYHENYGGTRVVRQNQTGLVGDAGRSTYIGVGTMSQTAQGKQVSGNPALPGVSMGGTIRTPGDNLYNGSNTIRMEDGSINYKDNIIREYQMRQSMQQQRILRQWQQNGGGANQYGRQNGNFYVPGSNGGVSSYGSSSTGGNYTYNNGVAGYGSYGGRR